MHHLYFVRYADRRQPPSKPPSKFTQKLFANKKTQLTFFCMFAFLCSVCDIVRRRTMATTIATTPNPTQTSSGAVPATMSVIPLNIEKVQTMLQACSTGNITTVQQLIQEHPMYVSQQDDTTGISPLMVASQVGNIELVQFLLDNGAPWNAIDRNSKCAGDYATDAEQWMVVNLLVEWATRSELILGATQRAMKQQQENNQETTMAVAVAVEVAQPPQQQEQSSSTKPDYLKHRLRYNTDGTALLDEDNDAVMMEWERPIMRAHASVMMESSPRRRVMNVGFGMGIIDTILQEYNPSLHIIIEAHPHVYQRMIEQQWDQKPNVKIYHGKWQDVIPQLIQHDKLELDSIFYDTYAEHAFDMEDFHKYVPQLLCKRQGIYSFFNGLAPDNLFFHGVACNVVKLQLSQLGFDSEFLQCQIEANNDKVWDGVRRKYWHNRDTYYLPRVTWNQEFLGRKNKAHGVGVETEEGADMELDHDTSNTTAKRQKMVV